MLTKKMVDILEQARKTGQKVFTNDKNTATELKRLGIEAEVVEVPEPHIAEDLKPLIFYDEFNEFIRTHPKYEMKNPIMQSQADNFQQQIFSGRCVSNCVPQRICVTCGGTAQQFKGEKQAKEYRLSGMCQKCQDETFGGCNA